MRARDPCYFDLSQTLIRGALSGCVIVRVAGPCSVTSRSASVLSSWSVVGAPLRRRDDWLAGAGADCLGPAGDS